MHPRSEKSPSPSPSPSPGRWKIIKRLLWTPERRVLIIQAEMQPHRSVLKAVQDTVQGPRGQALLREWLLLKNLKLSVLPQAEQLLFQGLFSEEQLPWLGFTQSFLEGEALEERLLRQKLLSPPEAHGLAKAVLLLLSRLEQARLVGLDLKPAHLFETRSGWKLIDVEQLAPPRPLSGPTLAGTPRYAAPELLEELPASISTELYSLGRVLLEALTGNLPMPEAPTLPARADALRRLPPLSEAVLQPLRAQAPGLAQLLPALLAPHPNQRPLHVQAALKLLGEAELTDSEGWLPPALSALQPTSEGLTPCPGQEKALKCLRDWLHNPTSAVPAAHRLTAPPGGGAKRFLDDACTQLQLEGVFVIRITSERSARPFALAERLLSQLQPTYRSSSLSSRARQNGPSTQGWGPEAERLAAFIAQLCRQLPSSTRLLLVVDAPHRLDEPSQRLLAALLPTLEDARLLLFLGCLPEPPAAALPQLQRCWEQLPGIELPHLTFEQARDITEARLRTTLNLPTLQALYTAAEQRAGRLVLGLKHFNTHHDVHQTVSYLRTLETPSEPVRLIVSWQKVEEATQQGELLLAQALAKSLLESTTTPALRTELLRRLAELALALDHPTEALKWLHQLPEQATERNEAAGLRTRLLYARAHKALEQPEQGLSWLEQLPQSPAWQDLTVEEQLASQCLEAYLALTSKHLTLAERQLPALLDFSQRADVLSRVPAAWLEPKVLAVWLRLLLPLPQTPEQQKPLTDELVQLVEQAKRANNRVQLTRVRSLLNAWAKHIQHPLALQWHEQEAQEAREAFALPQEASALANLGRLLLSQQALEQAEEVLTRAMTLFTRLGDSIGQRRALLLKTELYAQSGRPGSARQTLREVQALMLPQPHPTQQAWADYLDGLLRRREGLHADLLPGLQHTFERLHAAGEPELALGCGLELLEHLAELRQRDEARRLQPLLETLLASHGSVERQRRFHLVMATLNGATLEAEAPGRVTLQDLEWLKQLEKLVDPSGSLQELAGSVATTLEKLLGGKVLVMLRGPAGIVQDHTGLSPEQLPALSKSIAEHVLTNGESLHIPDLTASDQGHPFSAEPQLGATLRQRQHYRSVVCVPVRHASRLVGAFYVAHPQVGAVTEPLALQAIERVAQLTGKLLCWQDAELMAAQAEDLPSFGLVGKSPLMQRLRRQVHQVSGSERQNLTVLFRGESGVGKSTLAQILHSLRHGPHSKAPFISCDLTIIPEPLLGAELVGYAPSSGIENAEKGGKAGWFERANGGTLFLDEVQHLSLAHQKSLLTILSEGQVLRLGATQKTPFSCDLVLGTSKDLRELVEQGLFLKALANRMWINPISVPSLQARGPEDIRLLLEAEVRSILELPETALIDLSSYFTQAALIALQQYPWPGNVRELKNVMINERVCNSLKLRQRLDVELLTELTLTPLVVKRPGDFSPLDGLKLDALDMSFESFDLEILTPLRRRFLDRMIARYGTKRKAAEKLKLSRTTLDRLLNDMIP